MKQTKIKSGQREVYSRVQFQVKTGLQLLESWLEEELRDKLMSSHPLTHTTIEVKKGPVLSNHPINNPVFTYCITFAPSVIGHSHRKETLTIDEILAALVGIETDVRAAMEVKHLLSGLESVLQLGQSEAQSSMSHNIFLKDGDKAVGTIIPTNQPRISKVDGKVFVETDECYPGLKEEPTLAVSDKDGVLLLQRIDGTITFYPEALEWDITILNGVLSLRRAVDQSEPKA